MIFGGSQSSTFILDTRYSTIFTWYQIPLQSTTPPASPDSVLYATSRWVLHFRVEINIAYIDLFDPTSFQWYDTFNTDQTRTTTELWRLDISTWTPDTLTLTKLNTLIQQSNTISGGGSVIVTPLNDEIALFYGGNEQLAFLNTTNLTFISPQWIDNTSLISQNNNLAIILGSVLEKEKMITTRAFEESPPLSEFTLLPIKRLSPIELFYPAAVSSLPDAPEDEIVVLPQQQQQNIKKSRFREHFDFHSFPQDTTITPSKSLPLETSSTTITNHPQQQLLRSSSSYV
ncbi:hypothetical protein INT48_006735 [Thamnidium elegans]|uniref:Uncharacterized protein n=1 Tax=Thamnidium elegans TaxID=101142 RepID=A0A8H7VZW2_9FUNG|nr:hypothetical protein INT48_006735 [Thamnidium elegans]